MTEEEFLNDIVRRQNTIELQARRISELEAALEKIASDPLPLAWSAQYIARAALEGKAND